MSNNYDNIINEFKQEKRVYNATVVVGILALLFSLALTVVAVMSLLHSNLPVTIGCLLVETASLYITVVQLVSINKTRATLIELYGLLKDRARV